VEDRRGVIEMMNAEKTTHKNERPDQMAEGLLG